MNLDDLVTGNLAPGFGMIILIIFLRENITLDRKVKRIFYQVIVLEMIEMIAYNLELWTASFMRPTMFRILLSAIGYSIRPILVCMVIKLYDRENESKIKKYLLAIPAIWCIIVSFSAFVTDIAYSYDIHNVFRRGPLGYVPLTVIVFYLLVLLIITVRNQSKVIRLETVTLLITIAYITIAMILEAAYDIRSIGRSAIIFSTIFYYMFFQTQRYRNSVEEIKKKSEEEKQIDELTQLLNKKGFLQEAEKVLSLMSEENMALIFFDIDHFKEVNDRLGHIKGDQVLREVAKKIRSIFQEDDIIGRFGGDEFYALVRNTSHEDFCNRLYLLLNEVKSEYSNGMNTVQITVSIGAVYFAGNQAIEFIELLNLADTATYEAKNAGRNRYVVKKIA